MLYAIQTTDGSVEIMQTEGDTLPDECIAKWPDGKRAKVVSVTAISEVPADRTFRGAWAVEGKRVVHDMAKARDIQRDRMRRARLPLLAKLDVDYQRADETGDAKAKADVAARKQVLRDVTKHPAIESAETTDELAAVWPDCLGEPSK